MEIIIQVLLLAAGFVMLIKGADIFVDGASGVARKFGIPQLVIGLTVVAMGTSAPEAAVSISAALQHNADITIGNIVGSNILNILIILGLSSVIAALPVAKSTIKYEIPFMLIITAILLLLGLDGIIGLLDGIILIAAFLLYLFYLLRMAKSDKNEEAEAPKEMSLIKTIVFVILGLALIIGGSTVTVDSAVEIAKAMGVSERFIGLTIVSLGTSLPELFTSVSAARKTNADIAIGNIVGSNIFNILFVIGISALITPVPFSPNFIFDTIIAAVSAVLLLLCCIKSRSLNRISGIIMLIGYIAYFIAIL